MHLVFYLRGVPQQVTLWKAMAQSQFFRWRKTNMKTNKEEEVLIQGGLRDSVLGTMEYTFPEEALASVLNMFGLHKGELGVVPSWKISMKVGFLRKILGLKKIPKKAFKEAMKIAPSITIKGSERGLSNLYTTCKVSIHPIGIKKDVRRECVNKPTGYAFIQEMI